MELFPLAMPSKYVHLVEKTQLSRLMWAGSSNDCIVSTERSVWPTQEFPVCVSALPLPHPFPGNRKSLITQKGIEYINTLLSYLI